MAFLAAYEESVRVANEAYERKQAAAQKAQAVEEELKSLRKDVSDLQQTVARLVAAETERKAPPPHNDNYEPQVGDRVMYRKDGQLHEPMSIGLVTYMALDRFLIKFNNGLSVTACKHELRSSSKSDM